MSQKAKLIIDVLMFVCFIIIVISGFMLWLGGRIGQNPWLPIHNWFGIALVLLVIIHLILNWSWIKSWLK